jgi:hypothetical protein
VATRCSSASEEHEADGGIFLDKILYSNGTGLGDPSLLEALQRVRLSRIEMSRHSLDNAKNNAIMRFRNGVAVKETLQFEANIELALRFVPVKLVCVLQKGGVEVLEDVVSYLDWADQHGVDTVVFRELSRLHDLYKPNATAKYVESSRVAIEPLVDHARNDGRFTLQQVTNGYYYWNVMFAWRSSSGRQISAIFETSDYLLMKKLHLSDVVYKLVFHANGNLCSDWDPNTGLLFQTQKETT